jgi:hypothetical protein
MASNIKFMLLGKSKWVHVITTKAKDLKTSQCQQVRKYHVAGKVPKGKGMSPDAASALDPCPHCDAKRLIKIAIKESMTPEQRKAESKAKRDETLAKMQPKKKGKAKKAASKSGKPKKVTKSGGNVSSGDNKGKAEALAAFAKEHGWKAKVADANPGLLVTAVRGAETIRCYFVDGKYDTTRHASLEVGDWTGKLRGVHGCRKQMAGEGRDRPHPKPGQGRSGPRPGRRKDAEEIPEDESPEDAMRRVPFSVDDDPIVVIDAIKGKTIRWRNGTSNLIEEAWLPGAADGKKRSKIAITQHPKTGRRMVNFLTVTAITEHGEQYGPERSVYLDKIVRVVN